MASPSAEDVIRAFVDVVRSQLTRGETVHVPDLGTFSVEHRPSELKEDDDSPTMVPPRDEVTFTPDD